MTKKKRITIILPTYNEALNIRVMINELFKHIQQLFEIIVVDDNSSDGTCEEVENINDKRIKLIKRRKIKGLASALNRGIIESTGDIIGWLDTDMPQLPPVLAQMTERLSDNDVVIASRYVKGGRDQRSKKRVLASVLINKIAEIVLGHGIKDYDSGIILMHRHVLDHVTIIPTGFGEYFIELIYNCCEKGLKVYEYPYILRSRDSGESKAYTDIFSFIKRGFFYFLRIFVAKFRN